MKASVAAPLMGASRAWAGANDRIRVAIIGMGGRSRDHIREMSRIPGVELACFCDPDETLMAQKAADLEKAGGRRPAVQPDLRRVFEDRSIDAVTIAPCNHWHALAGIWGLQAGKHVYVEKPLCHDMFSGAQLVAAARRYQRMAQGGTQRRSAGTVQQAIRSIEAGVIGDVYMARCVHYQLRDAVVARPPENPPSTLHWDLWLGPARQQAFQPHLHPYNWHWFWDFGNGELGNNGVHFIDIARWGLKQRMPVRVHSTGGRFGYQDAAQTPNTQLTTYQFANGTELVVEIRGRYTNHEGDFSSGVMFYGSKGYMTVDVNDRVAVYPEGRAAPAPPPAELADLQQTSGRNATYAHMRNFFDAIRANRRESLAAEVEETYLSTAFCLLGNISYRVGRELRFDPKTQRFQGDAEADRLLRDHCRPPFVVPEKV